MAKEIPLTQGQVALVDDEDYEWLNQRKWHANYDKSTNGFYAMTTLYLGWSDGKSITKHLSMHRLIMNASSGTDVDHINHNALDNRKINLRAVSRRQNSQNRKDKFSKLSSHYPGVSWDRSREKWRAVISLNGKQKHLGRFLDEREAAKAYETACRELVGEELVCKANKVVLV